MAKRPELTRFSLRLPPDVLARLEAEAAANHVSTNTLIIHALMARQAEAAKGNGHVG